MKNCRKVKYPNENAAWASKRRMKNSLLNVYKCEKCGAWHLGRSNAPWRIYERIGQVLDRYEEKLKNKMRK